MMSKLSASLLRRSAVGAASGPQTKPTVPGNPVPCSGPRLQTITITQQTSQTRQQTVNACDTTNAKDDTAKCRPADPSTRIKDTPAHLGYSGKPVDRLWIVVGLKNRTGDRTQQNIFTAQKQFQNLLQWQRMGITVAPPQKCTNGEHNRCG